MEYRGVIAEESWSEKSIIKELKVFLQYNRKCIWRKKQGNWVILLFYQDYDNINMFIKYYLVLKIKFVTQFV